MRTTEAKTESDRAGELLAAVKERQVTETGQALEAGRALLSALAIIAAGEDDARVAAARERVDVYLEGIRALLSLPRRGA